MPGLVHYLSISCSGLSSSSHPSNVMLPLLLSLGFCPGFLLCAADGFPSSLLLISSLFVDLLTRRFSVLLVFYPLNLVLHIYKNTFLFVVFGTYHLAFEFCSCTIQRSSDMAPFLFLLLCMDYTPVNIGNSFLGVCSYIRNPAAEPFPAKIHNFTGCFRSHHMI